MAVPAASVPTALKSLCKTSFQLRIGLKKGQKQGRDERMQEDYCTSAVYFLLMSNSLVAFFHLCHISVFSTGPSLTEMKFNQNFSLTRERVNSR